eukprot:TRINITY_DN20772_c0_g1_i1.p1 TRINITY_DN20772_c0_g1~~TRINITY_DN20772_c0_g1_i1.p1  ORF type:complete len:349 (+),score=40.18 TRINITY_DN20772_c0_g1_i1:79-1047(+)
MQQSSTLFDGPVDLWWQHRSALIRRHAEWHAHPVVPPKNSDLKELFPPPGSSRPLCAGSRWRPAEKVQIVLVNAGGIYGGDEGPGGLWDSLAALPQLSFLQLDTGHSMEVAVPVLRAALKWLLHQYPHARILFGGFSMGSATIAQVGAEFRDAVVGAILVSGQTAGTEGFSSFGGKEVLVIHGERDVMVPAACADDLGMLLSRAGASVRVHILQQRNESSTSLSRMQWHHLWHERHVARDIVLEWLGAIGLSHVSENIGSRQISGHRPFHQDAVVAEPRCADVDDVAELRAQLAQGEAMLLQACASDAVTNRSTLSPRHLRY